MKEWLSAREIADEALPDMPATESAIIRKIKSEGWNGHPSFARGRPGRGGGMEYHIHLLPRLAQIAYHQKHMVVALPEPQTQASDTAPSVADLTARASDHAPPYRCAMLPPKVLARDSIAPTDPKRKLARQPPLGRWGSQLETGNGAIRTCAACHSILRATYSSSHRLRGKLGAHRVSRAGGGAGSVA